MHQEWGAKCYLNDSTPSDQRDSNTEATVLVKHNGERGGIQKHLKT
jgi:hypothetical protein